MFVALRVHDRFVELMVTARVTVPANPLRGATVIVEAPATPVLTVTSVVLAVTVKSWTWYVTLAARDRALLVPVTVARSLPAMDAEQDRVELPEPPTILVEDNVQDRFVELVITARVTVPEKPFNGATVTPEVPATPAFTATLVALAVTVKSWTWNTTLAAWLRVPLVPATTAV
jgi:hypothetical protein